MMSILNFKNDIEWNCFEDQLIEWAKGKTTNSKHKTYVLA